jgi:hypothetical protein
VGGNGFSSPKDEELEVPAAHTPAAALDEQELAALA